MHPWPPVPAPVVPWIRSYPAKQGIHPETQLNTPTSMIPVGYTNMRKRALTTLTVLPIALIVAGIVADVRSFDRTNGGHEPPYTDYTGEPTDWTTVQTTEMGMRSPGYVVDVHANCTSGMIHFEVFGISVPFRKFSSRALVVHQPRQACIERGFTPRF